MSASELEARVLELRRAAEALDGAFRGADPEELEAALAKREEAFSAFAELARPGLPEAVAARVREVLAIDAEAQSTAREHLDGIRSELLSLRRAREVLASESADTTTPRYFSQRA